MDVKLLLSEYSECGESASYGDHQPSATTWPWRTTIKLCRASIFLSAASTNARIAELEMPCCSGSLRGRPDDGSAARDKPALPASNPTKISVFILASPVQLS